MDEASIGRQAGEGKGTKRGWWIAGGGVAALLVIAGLVLWRAQAGGWEVSWAALTGRPVAVVNGEAVSRADFGERLQISRGMLERQYGKGLFSGRRGGALLAELETNLLERVILERLVSQEAKRLKITVTDAQVRQEWEAIGKEVYGSPENFQASLREEGIREEYLFGHIRTLLLRKEVDRARLATAGHDGAPLGDWLAQARQAAKVDIDRPAGLSRAAGGTASCGEPPGAAGGDEASGKGLAPDPKDEAATAGPAADRKANPSGKERPAKVTAL